MRTAEAASAQFEATRPRTGFDKIAPETYAAFADAYKVAAGLVRLLAGVPKGAAAVGRETVDG
jgi:hypothetical protein